MNFINFRLLVLMKTVSHEPTKIKFRPERETFSKCKIVNDDWERKARANTGTARSDNDV